MRSVSEPGSHYNLPIPMRFALNRTLDRPMSNNAVLAALRSMGYDKETMTGHGFRAMARTLLEEVLQVRPDFIEHQLAHAARDQNGRAYNRTAHLNEKRKMMHKWADYLDGLKRRAKMIQLKRRDTQGVKPHQVITQEKSF